MYAPISTELKSESWLDLQPTKPSRPARREPSARSPKRCARTASLRKESENWVEVRALVSDDFRLTIQAYVDILELISYCRRR